MKKVKPQTHSYSVIVLFLCTSSKNIDIVFLLIVWMLVIKCNASRLFTMNSNNRAGRHPHLKTIMNVMAYCILSHACLKI